jgi:hypothetical protein
MTEVDAAFPVTFTAFYGGHAHGSLDSTEAVAEFLDGAADMVGPSGEHSTAELATDDGEIALEFALFEDCAYLRRGDTVAVDPAFLDESGHLRTDLTSPAPRLVHNLMDEVEALPSAQLRCTPQWVRGIVATYATTGHLPDHITWIETSSTDQA